MGCFFNFKSHLKALTNLGFLSFKLLQLDQRKSFKAAREFFCEVKNFTSFRLYCNFEFSVFDFKNIGIKFFTSLSKFRVYYIAFLGKSILLYTAEMIPKLKTRQVNATPGPSQQSTTGGKKKKR